MKKALLLTMAVLAAIATGCSKSDSENMEEIDYNAQFEQATSEIKSLLVGTWVHDGDSNSDVKSIGSDGFTITDAEYTFIESEKDTLTFTADGKVTNKFPEDTDWPLEIIQRFGFETSGLLGTIGYSGIIIEGGYLPPYTVGIALDSGYWGFRGGRFDIFFDSQRKYLYLHSNDSHHTDAILIYRYRKIG